MSPLPLLSDIDTALYKAGIDIRGAEAHGMLCGMLCARGSFDRAAWSEHVLGDLDGDSPALQDAVHQLSLLYDATVEQLNDALGGYYLLLPDEEERLSARVTALAEWCRGFQFGLAVGGIRQDTELPADSREIISDMIEISRAGVQEQDSVDEDDEAALMELVEYVRTGVLLINEELQPLKMNNTIQ